MPPKTPAGPPARVHVPWQKRPPRGVLWAAGEVLGFHAVRPHYNYRHMLDIPAAPARMDEFRQVIRDNLDGRAHHTSNFRYWRGRNVACPYRCALDSKSCPVDVLVEELNRPRTSPPRAPAP